MTEEEGQLICLASVPERLESRALSPTPQT